MAKGFAIVNGKVVRMSEAAFRIASKHFGALREAPEYKVIPPELLKIPKAIITPAAKPANVVVPVELEKIIAPPVELEVKQSAGTDKVTQDPSEDIIVPIIKKPVKRPARKK